MKLKLAVMTLLIISACALSAAIGPLTSSSVALAGDGTGGGSGGTGGGSGVDSGDGD